MRAREALFRTNSLHAPPQRAPTRTLSFVSEHIETLEEIDCEYRELAEESGIKQWARVPALGLDGRFIDALADAVIEALPGLKVSCAAPCCAARALGAGRWAPGACGCHAPWDVRM